MARLVTRVTRDDYVYQDPMDPRPDRVKGILYDLWDKVATDLNLTFKINVVNNWLDMVDRVRMNQADVALQRMDWSMVDREDFAM